MAVHNITYALLVAHGVALGALVLWGAHRRLSERRQLQLAYAWRKCTFSQFEMVTLLPLAACQ